MTCSERTKVLEQRNQDGAKDNGMSEGGGGRMSMNERDEEIEGNYKRWRARAGGSESGFRKPNA